MIHRVRSGASSLAAAALVLALGHPALAEEPAVAPVTGSAAVALSERRAAEAFQAYTKKNYAAAVALYMEAYEAAPSGSILYNVARIYDMKLGDRPLAISFYRRFIADPGAHTALIVDANQRLRELRDAELMASRLTEQDSAREADAQRRQLAGAERAKHGTTEVDRRGGWSRSRWIGAAVGALGVVGVGVGAGFGWAAMSKANTAKDLCDGNACTSQRGVDAANEGRRDATISNIGFAAGGVLLVTGGALFLFSGERASERGSDAGIHLDTRATASGLSLQVSGKW